LFVPVAVLVIIISIAPSIDALVASFDVGLDRFAEEKSGIEFGVGHYQSLFKDQAIMYSLNITALWAGVNSATSIVVSVLLAHLMHVRSRITRHKRKTLFSQTILYPFLMIPLGIPIYIAVPLWRAFIHGDAGVSLFSRITGITMNLITDPVAAFVAALMVSVWLNVPITTFVIRSHLEHVDREMIDAARLETKHTLTIMRYIEFPIIRSSVLTMLALNFVKAFKEFTLIHLMTNGGVPLVSGITERYIVGSTTTLGIFIYNLFGSGTYGITAAFSVCMAVAVAIVLLFWVCSVIPEVAKRTSGFKLLISVLLAFEILFDMVVLHTNVSVPRLAVLLGLVVSFRHSRLFPLSLWALLAYHALDIFMNGFLQGFSPLVPAALYILLQQRSQYRETHRLVLPNRMRSRWSAIADEVAEQAYRFVMYAVAAATILSTALIVYYLVWLSISGINACYFDTILPSRISLQAFVDLFAKEHIMTYFANTAILAIGSALLVPLVVIPAAWYLSTINKEKANGIVSSIHTLGTMGGMHSLIPLFSVFLALGLIDSYFGLILIYVVHAIPFSLVNMKNFFEGYSKELREPAVLEGATTVQYLWYVLVPLSRPIIKTAMLMAFLGAWNGFNAPLLFLTEESMYPVSLKLYTFVGSIASGNPRWNLFAAASIINLAIITVIGGRRLSKNPQKMKNRTTLV
jgi:ABC-type glycerol-3-phosphate transport system permease component